MHCAKPLGEHVSRQLRACVVLPCFNEGFRIAGSLATLYAWFGSTTEVLVVDDGSADDTFEQAERYAAAHPHVRVHRRPEHRGKGAAIRAAIPLLRTDRVVFVDADLAFTRQSIERALDGLASADMVIGNRRHHGSYYSVPVRLFGFLHRRHLVGLFFNAVVRAVLPVRVRDTQCGLKAFQRAVLVRMAPAMHTDGFAFDGSCWWSPGRCSCSCWRCRSRFTTSPLAAASNCWSAAGRWEWRF